MAAARPPPVVGTTVTSSTGAGDSTTATELSTTGVGVLTTGASSIEFCVFARLAAAELVCTGVSDTLVNRALGCFVNLFGHNYSFRIYSYLSQEFVYI